MCTVVGIETPAVVLEITVQQRGGHLRKRLQIDAASLYIPYCNHIYVLQYYKTKFKIKRDLTIKRELAV